MGMIQKAVIIGISSLFLVIVFGVMAKLYIYRYKRQHKDNEKYCVTSPTNSYHICESPVIKFSH